ncbi:hypothetical protein DPMN_088572 [Dreissena polymorpha]|uniref:Uncharacterized protein n=1 Tax=Dreissena polymorpha TaxID=45954 RepID=A0A9D4KV91_DREPO|nr:hypothetical protein DPMN_088572 [Dreissena polymorpha]
MYSAQLPRLNKLTLTDLASVSNIRARDKFFQSIAGGDIKRNITNLDISNISFRSIDFKAFMKSGLCNSVNEVYVKHATINKLYLPQQPCSSLKVIDISDSHVSIVLSNRQSCGNICINVEELYMNGLGKYRVTPPLQDELDRDLTSCPYKIKKVSLENNLIKRLSFSVKLHNYTKKTVEWISLSENILEFLSTQFLSPLMNLQYLDISRNQLHKMQEHYEETLIKENTKMKVLKLNNNGFARIHFNMCLTNSDLLVLDLSHNNLSSLDFKIGHLTNLKVLNLSYNAIHSIDVQTMETMGQLASATNALLIDLSNMLCSCSCDDDNKETIQWIHAHLDTG